MVAVDERAGPRADPAVTRFDEVFRSCYGSLYALAYRLLGDRHEAEDVLQEVFLKLAGAPVLARPDEEVRAWLRRVCLNAGANRLRGRRRSSEHLQLVGRLTEVADADAGDDDPLAGVLRHERQQSVRRALAALPERQRACLLLRQSGYSYAEIAATLDIAIGSVGVLLARAERTFRDTYHDQESER